MRNAWVLPLALNSIFALAAPAADKDVEQDVPVYGHIKLTYTTPEPSPISLNLGERDVAEPTAAFTGSCLTKPSNLHTESRTRAHSHIRHCGETGGTCLTSSSGFLSSYKATPSSKPVITTSPVVDDKHVSSAPVSTLTTSTTTVITTIYETYCPGTSTVTYGGSTYPVEYPSSTLTTETYTTVYPVETVVTLSSGVPSSVAAPSSSAPITEAGSSTKAVPASSSTSCTNDFGVVPPYDFLLSSTKAAPASSTPVVYTTESTYYVTSTVVKYVTVPCPGTKTVTSESSVYTTTYASSSVETSTETTKVPVTTTLTLTSSAAVVPSTKAVPSSSAPATSSVPATSSAPAKDYKTTVYTTVYTTTCPGTTTITSYGSTFTKEYPSSTVVTETVTSTYPAESEPTETYPAEDYPEDDGEDESDEDESDEDTYPAETSSVFRHHSHSHHGHASSTDHQVKAPSSGVSSTLKPTKSLVSSGKPSSTGVSSKVSSSAVSSKVSSSAVSSKASSSAVSSKVSSSVSASASVSASRSASSASASQSASKTSSLTCRTPTPDPACVPCEGQPGNDPTKWCGLTINDNNYEVIPKTCRTVVYDFTITNTTIAPDGYDRMALLVNGEMPGPTIEANWGDTIIVNVHNEMQNNGTSIHFHGARQHGTNEMDGATSVTQCPIAPGDSYTYKFVASNYGHSWYHSHFALQTYNGVFGPMVINGPHSAEYDVDAGVLSLQDWSHDTVDMMFEASQTVGPFPEHGPRTLDGGLINGLNVYGNGGERFVLDTEFEAGKSYLLRLVNVANQASFKFYIDNHELEVISADYVPITPYKTNIVNIHPGQRYEVIVKANQTPGSYWIRSDSQDPCSNMTNSKDIKAVVNYVGFNEEPTSTAYNYTEECVDEPLASIIPIVPIDAGAKDESISKTVLIGPGPQTPNLYKWTLDGSTFVSRWSDPSLWELAENGTIPNYAGSLQIQYPKLGEWVYMVIQSPIPLPHPIHFHGHDFMVVGQGTGFYTGQPLNLKAPPRRDTALMPSSRSTGGYLVIAWETDNPGAWLMHCHIGFHAVMGFTLEIIEGDVPTIEKTLTNTCQLDQTCKSWNKYAAANNIVDEGT